MYIIGENIHIIPPAVKKALAERDAEFFKKSAIQKVEIGADAIDLNIGRYLYPLKEGNTDDDRIPFWSVDDQVDGPFRFELVLKSAFPIKDVRVPGFETTAHIEKITAGTEEEGAEEEATGEGSVYRVTIENVEGSALNRDVVVYYRLDDTAPARVELIPTSQSLSERQTAAAASGCISSSERKSSKAARIALLVIDWNHKRRIGLSAIFLSFAWASLTM